MIFAEKTPPVNTHRDFVVRGSGKYLYLEERSRGIAVSKRHADTCIKAAARLKARAFL